MMPNFRRSIIPQITVDSELKLLKQRDPAFLRTLFEELNPLMIRFLAGHGIYDEQAEDVVHQTWETFFSNLDRFEGRARLKTFLTGILLNKVREKRRAEGRWIPDEEASSFLDQSFTPEGWWKRVPADPQQLMESGELTRFVEECIEALSEAQRSAFVLIELEEEETEETCNVLQVSATHLRVLLFRAKQKLRACLEGKVVT